MGQARGRGPARRRAGAGIVTVALHSMRPMGVRRMLLLLSAATTLATTGGPTPLEIRVAKCSRAVRSKGIQQRWKPLVATGSGGAPIVSADGSCCISTLSCHTCASDCRLSCAPCNHTDAYQRFEYNASTGVVGVPAAAAPDCSARPSLHGPWCFNLFANARSDGQAVDVYTCGYPTGDLLLAPGKAAGTLEVRDADTLCLSAGPASAWPAPPPAPPPPPPPPPPRDPELDCALRMVALEMAAANLPLAASHAPYNLRSVFDALELGNCSAAPPRPGAPQLPRGVTGPSPLEDALFVDGIKGSDAAIGTEAAPLKTVGRAVQLSTGHGRAGTVIMLRAGTHFLAETLEITPTHSGLSIRAFPDESATLSGGTPLSLQFRTAASSEAWWAGETTVLVADLPAGASSEWTEVFVMDGVENQLNLGGGGSRYTKARFPDGDPEQDSGLCTTTNGCRAYAKGVGSCGSVPFVNGTWIESGPRRNSWNAVSSCPTTDNTSVFETGKCAHGKCCAGYVYDVWTALLGGSAAGRFSPPLAPSSTVTDQQDLTNCETMPVDFSPRASNWSSWPATARPLLHSFNYPMGSAWGNHMYEVTRADLEMVQGTVKGNLSLGRGGWHLTAGLAKANSFFTENVKEELTSPGEFYLEHLPSGARRLWIAPNSSAIEATAKAEGTVQLDVVMAGLKRLISISGGSPAGNLDRVQDVSISGLSIQHSAQTYVPSVGGPYEVPSNGDWSVLREGAIWIGDGAVNTTIDGCRFWRLGGNGLVLSNHARGSTISENEFAFLGESAVVLVGSTSLHDGTVASFPRNNRVIANNIHDIGLWTKQVAGFTQFVSSRTTVARNVIYNTPRAGINLNDNFGGGNVIEANAVFNTVRETNDHGPINSWSRQGWITTEGPPGPGEADGHATPSTAVSWNLIKGNMVGGFSANEHGGMPLDYDDGTEYMHSVSNVLVYGGLKACWHSNNQRYENNLIVRPDLGRLGPQACSGCIAGTISASTTLLSLPLSMYIWLLTYLKTLAGATVNVG